MRTCVVTLKNIILKLAQLAATCGLLSLVAYQAGLFSASGQQQFTALLVGADLLFLMVAVFIGVLVNMVSAYKWYRLTLARQLGAGYWRIFAYYVVGQFYNMFLPTSVGGDVVRSYELGKFSGRQADAMASVFVERYTGVVVLLLFAALAVIAQLSRFGVDYVVISLSLFGIGLVLIGWLVLDQRAYRLLREKVVGVIPVSTTIFTKLDSLLSAVDAYRNQPAAIMFALINSVFFYLIAVVNVLITAWVFDVNVTLIHMLLATPIIMVIMNLPISFGNIGLMEFAYTNVFILMGYGAELGLSVALLMRFKSFFDGAIGGILHPLFVTQKHE